MFLVLVILFYEVKDVLNLCLLVDGITNYLFINVTDVNVTALDIINSVIVGFDVIKHCQNHQRGNTNKSK